jgi:hypothetical protein
LLLSAPKARALLGATALPVSPPVVLTILDGFSKVHVRDQNRACGRQLRLAELAVDVFGVLHRQLKLVCDVVGSFFIVDEPHAVRADGLRGVDFRFRGLIKAGLMTYWRYQYGQTPVSQSLTGPLPWFGEAFCRVVEDQNPVFAAGGRGELARRGFGEVRDRLCLTRARVVPPGSDRRSGNPFKINGNRLALLGVDK